jgi:mRNA-degrading endonuclease RelE of RelBE toxin-antitoxin system
VFTVVITPEAAAQIQSLPMTIRARLLSIVARLQRWPEVSGAKPLRGNLAGHFRIRTGDYRIQFRVSGERLIIEKAGHRDGFYED